MRLQVRSYCHDWPLANALSRNIAFEVVNRPATRVRVVVSTRTVNQSFWSGLTGFGEARLTTHGWALSHTSAATGKAALVNSGTLQFLGETSWES